MANDLRFSEVVNIAYGSALFVRNMQTSWEIEHTFLARLVKTRQLRVQSAGPTVKNCEMENLLSSR